MANVTFRASEEYELRLSRLANESPNVITAAIYAGARVIADAIKAALNALPTDKFRYLRNGDKYKGLTEDEKRDLQESFGITPIRKGSDGNWSAKVGFDGYGSTRTLKYPKGVPNQLTARAAESGSRIREKTPFVRTSVNRVKGAAQAAMEEAGEAEIRKIFEP